VYLFLHQGVGGAIPALVDVSLSKTLNPELLPVAVFTVYECNIFRLFEYLFKKLKINSIYYYEVKVQLVVFPFLKFILYLVLLKNLSGILDMGSQRARSHPIGQLWHRAEVQEETGQRVWTDQRAFRWKECGLVLLRRVPSCLPFGTFTFTCLILQSQSIKIKKNVYRVNKRDRSTTPRDLCVCVRGEGRW